MKGGLGIHGSDWFFLGALVGGVLVMTDAVGFAGALMGGRSEARTLSVPYVWRQQLLPISFGMFWRDMFHHCVDLLFVRARILFNSILTCRGSLLWSIACTVC